MGNIIVSERGGVGCEKGVSGVQCVVRERWDRRGWEGYYLYGVERRR